MTLLSALLYSQQTNKLLIHFPSLFSFTHANHTVEAYSTEQGILYEQDNSVSEWLKYLQNLNPFLNDKQTTDHCCYQGEEDMAKFEVNKGVKFEDLIKQVVQSNSYPSKVLEYVLEQILKIENRPSVVIAMDGLNALFCRTDIRLEQYGPPLMPRDLTLMRTIYDLIFSGKYTELLKKDDCIIGSVTHRGVLSVKGIRDENTLMTQREKRVDFNRVFRPQALREDVVLNVRQEDVPFYSKGMSYKLVGIEGELLEMDRLVEFGFAEGDFTNSIELRKLLEQSKDWEVNIEVKDKILYLHYKHLDDVARDKIYNPNYLWKTELLLGDEGMSKVFNNTEPFTAIEMDNWSKEEVATVMRGAVKDLWAKKNLEEDLIEETYPLSSYGNPRLVHNLCRMVFEH